MESHFFRQEVKIFLVFFKTWCLQKVVAKIFQNLHSKLKFSTWNLQLFWVCCKENPQMSFDWSFNLFPCTYFLFPIFLFFPGEGKRGSYLMTYMPEILVDCLRPHSQALCPLSIFPISHFSPFHAAAWEGGRVSGRGWQLFKEGSLKCQEGEVFWEKGNCARKGNSCEVRIG